MYAVGDDHNYGGSLSTCTCISAPENRNAVTMRATEDLYMYTATPTCTCIVSLGALTFSIHC